MALKEFFGKFFKKEAPASGHYLTGREVRAIAKANAKVMFALEKRKHRIADESEFTTTMQDNGNILEIDDLHTYFFTDQGVVKAVNGVSFNVPQNTVVGVVGESGCGKSVTSMSIMQLLQGPQGQIYSGQIRFKAYDFVRDGNGNPIPIYATDEEGEVIMRPVTKKNGEPLVDGDGQPVMEPVPLTDENGVIQYEMEEKV